MFQQEVSLKSRNALTYAASAWCLCINLSNKGLHSVDFFDSFPVFHIKNYFVWVTSNIMGSCWFYNLPQKSSFPHSGVLGFSLFFFFHGSQWREKNAEFYQISLRFTVFDLFADIWMGGISVEMQTTQLKRPALCQRKISFIWLQINLDKELLSAYANGTWCLLSDVKCY